MLSELPGDQLVFCSMHHVWQPCRNSPTRSFKSSSLSVEIPTDRAEDACDSAGSARGPLTDIKVPIRC